MGRRGGGGGGAVRRVDRALATALSELAVSACERGLAHHSAAAQAQLDPEWLASFPEGREAWQTGLSSALAARAAHEEHSE